MIPDPGGLAAAAARQQREPVVTATIDWSGAGTDVYDLSPHLGQVSITRQIAGDLPDEATLVEGSAVADAKLQLDVGVMTDNAKHAAWLFSKLGSGTMAAKEHLSRPVTVNVGFKTTTGSTVTVRRFTGLSTSLPVSASNRAATLEALDYRQRFRAPVDVPALVADLGPGSIVKPGLNAQWLADLAFRRNGFYASPSRAGTVLSATMHGSAAPDIGTLQWAGWYSPGFGTFDEQCHFTQGRFGFALAGPALTAGDPDFYTWAGYTLEQPVDLPAVVNDYVLVEWWGQVDPALTVPPIRDLVGLSKQLTGGASITVQLTDVAGVRTLQVTYNRGTSGSSTVTTPLVSAASYFSVSVRMRAAGRRVEIRQDAAVATFDVADAASALDAAAMDLAQVSAMGLVEGVLVSSGNTGADVSPATAWGYVPTAELGPSANELVATLPLAKQDSWELLKEVAGAEFAWIGFDESTGNPFYRTSEWWTRTAQQTLAATITADRELLDAAYDYGLDSVRNQITVPVKSLTITPLRDVWTLGDELKSLGSKQRATFTVTFTDPLVDLDRSVQTVTGGVPGAGFSRVSANGQPDGSGFDRSSYIKVSIGAWTANSARITIANTYPGRLYLVDPTGQPGLHLAGRQMVVNEQSATAAYDEDTASIAQYGAQPLSLPDSQWRQDLASARGVAFALLSRLAEPVPTLTGLRVVGDPRRQNGDRVRVVDTDGLGLDGEFWLTGVNDEIGGGYTQTLSARQAWTVAVWGTSLWDDGTVWGP